jgi:hypothetical protein
VGDGFLDLFALSVLRLYTFSYTIYRHSSGRVWETFSFVERRKTPVRAGVFARKWSAKRGVDEAIQEYVVVRCAWKQKTAGAKGAGRFLFVELSLSVVCFLKRKRHTLILWLKEGDLELLDTTEW